MHLNGSGFDCRSGARLCITTLGKLLPSSIICSRPNGSDVCVAGEIAAGLQAESNDSLLPGLWLL